MSLWREFRNLKRPDADATLQADGPAPELSLIIPARNAADSIGETVAKARELLSQEIPGRFEIVLVPNARPGDRSDQTEIEALKLATNVPELRVVRHTTPPGKGASVRTGFLACRATRFVLFTDADLPYDLEFFSRALALLRSGEADLVTGNRRLPESVFDIPVELLPLAYGRHRLGLAFNRSARLLMPGLRTTDTQAGLKALSRRLADAAFSRQVCPGFFFDLEILLTARAQGWASRELPVILRLNSEKSTVRLLRDLALALVWLARIAARDLRGAYGPRSGGGA